MKVQTYVSEEKQREFVNSVKSVQERDTRLSNHKLSGLLGLSSSFFNSVLRYESRVSKDLYNKWFHKVKGQLNTRINNYDGLTSDKLVAIIKSNLPEKREEIQSKLMMSKYRFDASIKGKRRNNLLDMYDVIVGLPLYKDVSNKVNKQEIKRRNDHELVQKILDEIESMHLQFLHIEAVNYFVLPERPQIYRYMKRSPYLHLHANIRKQVVASIPKLEKFSKEVSKAVDQLPTRPSLQEIADRVGKSPKQLAEDSKKYFGREHFIYKSEGQLPNTISIAKAALVIAMENMIKEGN